MYMSDSMLTYIHIKDIFLFGFHTLAFTCIWLDKELLDDASWTMSIKWLILSSRL